MHQPDESNDVIDANGSLQSDAEYRRRLDTANGVLRVLGIPDATGRQQAIGEAVARGDRSAADAVAETIATQGLRHAPATWWPIEQFDDYLIPGAPMLRNRLVDDAHPFGIDDPDLFRLLDVELSRLRLIELAASPVGGLFDYAHFLAIHKRILGDVYPWAGSERVGPDTPLVTLKPDLLHFVLGDPSAAMVESTFYSGPEIAEAASLQYAQIAYLATATSMPWQMRLDRLSESGGELYVIHPVRDGNSRAQLMYAVEFFDRAQLPLRSSTYLENATVRNLLTRATISYSEKGIHHGLTTALHRASSNEGRAPGGVDPSEQAPE